MQRPGQHSMTHRHNHLDHPSHTSSSLRMTNIRLHRPQPQRPVLRSFPPIGGQQRTGLDRVTQNGTGTMRLHHIHIPRLQTSTSQRLTNDPFLRRTIRRRQPITRTILIHRRPTHNSQYLMTITQRIRQTLQHNQTHTLTPTRAVRSISKRLATPIHRQTTLTRERDKHRRRGKHRNTTRQRQRTLPTTQRPTRQMQSNKRRRTSRIHRHSRTLQPKRISHTPRNNTTPRSRAKKTLKLRRHRTTQTIIRRHNPRKDPSITTPQTQRINPSILQRLPRTFQKQPLLRIHRQRLTRTNLKMLRVKTTNIIKKTTIPRITSTKMIRIRIKQTLQIPTPIPRKPTNRINTRNNKPPQTLRRKNTTRITSTHTHNRNRLFCQFFGFFQPQAHVV